MNYEILISISLGDNFPLHDDFLLKDCRTHAILEAKFNEEVLQSDPIELNSTNPELATELGFRLNKKDFQQFRIERKSIKLQCYVEYSTMQERHFIGYAVLHLRDADEYTNQPKYKWHVLLNPKYKGSATKRPQLYLALMFNKLNDSEVGSDGGDQPDIATLHKENQFTRPLRKSDRTSTNDNNVSTSMIHFNEYDTNLKVKLEKKFFYIWDENVCAQKDCHQIYLLHVQIDKPRNLLGLFGKRPDIDLSSHFFFKYTLFGYQVKSSGFLDLMTCEDFKKHKFSFPIMSFNKKMLQDYFELYPTIEIQFCCSSAKLIGFVTINLLRLFQQSNANINGDYMIVPEDESVYVKEPFPMINLNISVSKNDSLHRSICENKVSAMREKPLKKSRDDISAITHYYIAIDLRTIKLCTSNVDNCQILFKPFYLQFSYAFFGLTEPIKTYPPINFDQEKPDNVITIPHGFCGFNFATTHSNLRYTFSNIPLKVQLILDEDNTHLGKAEIKLDTLLGQDTERIGENNFLNLITYVHDELEDRICEIQVVMFLQEIQNSTSNDEINSKLKELYSNLTSAKSVSEADIVSNINDAIIETSHDIELWKEEQMHLFVEKLKQKEASLESEECKKKKSEMVEMERQLKSLLLTINERENSINERERLVSERQQELTDKFAKLDQEIENAIHEVRLQYEEKSSIHKNRLSTLEHEKAKCLERIYHLERKVKEKDGKIKELEGQILQMNMVAKKKAQHERATSLTRNAGSNPRKIIITRDREEPMSKSMIEDGTSTKIAATSQVSSIPVRKVVTTASSKKPPVLVTKNDSFLMDKIRKERQELIKKGVSLNDPMIVEIDKRLKQLRLQSVH